MQRAVEALQKAGYRGPAVEALHPGQQRQDAVSWAISRLLGGGKSIDDIWPLMSSIRAYADTGASDQQLSEEERWAQRCQQLLALLGVKTTVDDIRGCGDRGGADLLLRLAELVQAVESQAAAASSSGRGNSSSRLVHPSPEAAQQLLAGACELGGRLFSDSLHLFPRDMAPLIEGYGDAAGRLPSTLQELQRRLASEQQLKPEAPAPGDTAVWHRNAAALTASVADLAEAGDKLAGVFQQELSVWSEGGGSPAIGGRKTSGSSSSSSGGGGVDGGLGAVASQLLAGCGSIDNLMQGVGAIMETHMALQEIPSVWLADTASQQRHSARELQENAAVLAKQ